LKFDLRDLELFVAVAESGSISRAAERCHTVPSAVSKRISDLEERFGTELLVRGGKGVELTAAGNSLAARAQVLLQHARQLEDELRRHASGTRGYVRVFANISAIVEFLPGALAAFAVKHPDIHVHLEEHVSAEIATAVTNNAADFGILSELPLAEDLVTVPFRNDELVLVAKPDDAIARRTAIAFADAAELPMIGLPTNSSLQQLLTRAALDSGATLNWRVHVSSFDAVCAMVAAGLGVSVIPRAATTPYIRSLRLAAIPLTDPWARRQLSLCTRANKPLHRAAQLLFDHLRAVGEETDLGR
jgi:DNA-binding transcriptional LysR family regulator